MKIARHNYRAMESFLREHVTKLRAAVREGTDGAGLLRDWQERAELAEGLADRMKREAEAPECGECGDTGEVELSTAPGTAPCGCLAGKGSA
ncbi:MAG: hypothetical protein ACLFRB_06670 [Thiohalorhabdus sp.]|uniref:hypothetical protein n=1 Tax=Thiohalorhabdus sp. TaxID=3094134 RepID=UPI003981146F